MNRNKRVLGATGGALGLGGVAAAIGACCAAPWAVGLLGVGGAIALARLAVLQPYLLIAAALLLGLAFFWAYRARRSCETGDCATAGRRWVRWVVWIALAVVGYLAVLALRPWLLPFA